MNFAIENDLTSCGARLVAKRASLSSVAAAEAIFKGAGFDQQTKFKTPEGKLLANFSYVITMENGEMVSGKTDVEGLTERLFTQEKTNVVNVVFDVDANLGDCDDE